MSKSKELYERGLQAERAGRPQEALKFYRACAREDPSFRPAFNNLGAMYSRARRPDLAVGFFKRALDLGEDDTVHFNLGSEFFRLEDFQQSLDHLKKALRLNPRLIRAHLLLAYLYGKIQKPDKADIYFQNSLKLDPVNRVAALGYAVSLAERGQAEQALVIVENFLSRVPQDVGLRNLRAGLLMKLNKYEESYNELARLAESSEKYKNFTDHLKAARSESNNDFNRVFEGINDKIHERTARLREKIERRKSLLKEARASGKAPAADAKQDPQEDPKQDLRDMMDLSFLHLFNGDTDKALKFLLQARKMNESRSNPR